MIDTDKLEKLFIDTILSLIVIELNNEDKMNELHVKV